MAGRGRPAVEVVAEVLAEAPGTTVADTAERAGLGASTVSKALALLEATGRARRAPGGRDGRRRLPDRWAPATDSVETALPATRSGATRPPRPAPGRAGGRLGRGQLDALVLETLAAQAGGEPVTAGTVAKALDRSAGAVSNCLARLAAAGRVRLVGQAPRRYAAGG